MTEVHFSKWRSYRFDEMAVEIKDRIDVPRESGLDRYVGLSHLDAGSLKIWRWGSTEDVKKQKVLFKSGDIIFGRRNAYLRRVSVADFDGVCSAHAMVLRARPEVVLPEFLPFFMQTETFWQAALRNSAGSLSPTINWSNIAKEEFVLPPLEEQRQITEILQAAEHAKQEFHALAASARLVLDSTATQLLKQGALKALYSGESVRAPAGWQVTTFDEVCERITYGFTNPMPTTEEGPWMVTAADVKDGCIIYDTARHTSQQAFDCDLTDKSRVRVGDVLLTKDGTLGRVAIVDQDNICINQSVAVLRPSAKILPQFLAWTLRAPVMQWRLMLDAGGSAVKHIYITKVAKTTFLIPPLQEQEKLVETLDSSERALTESQNRERECGDLAKAFSTENLERAI